MPNSHIKCKQCENDVPHETIITLLFGKFCCWTCVDIFVKDKQEKERLKKIKKAYGKKPIKSKSRENDLSHQLKLTQDVFNKLRRLQEFEWFEERGLDPECISCGKKNMDWCNGHLKTVGAHSELRFDPLNSYLQCNKYCNSSLSGNLNGTKTTRGYLKGLEYRFGEHKAQEIIDYCEIKRVRKWTCDELKEMRKQMNIEIRKGINYDHTKTS